MNRVVEKEVASVVLVAQLVGFKATIAAMNGMIPAYIAEKNGANQAVWTVALTSRDARFLGARTRSPPCLHGSSSDIWNRHEPHSVILSTPHRISVRPRIHAVIVGTVR
ncbi:hypothetical protein [Sorangium sp. So ce513]|uniref:hypothetical protein n=1 Tax=Sorangium sp. So ce513 TaxID=3133315 RepID=UPI003F5DF8C1